ncbi:prepilin peptidase [Ruminiclostridium cellobioparum]|uniref:Prepilin leader peptidase/N-methyltransferase n=1 Tax=Ruminiclostridium cellobioparum subsp. termitidis CT1112 TaxID=1195236 RepID=S0FM41_RUMCE|nr:A24 family peptidase [Ruminiclostridium cellobioparum]EMS71361.1 prepilin signal peptidase [Ruminiclostridium cellobioparum subsp. termitidis CT1112]
MVIFITYLYVALIGLIIGSFLNVCIYRIPRGESVVTVPSHCTGCGKKLGALNLIPVFSYLCQRGRCTGCGGKISPRYMLVEILTAGLFTGMLYKYGISPEFFSAVFLSSILIVVFFIDLEHGIIPDSVVVTAAIGGLVFFVISFFIPSDIYGDEKWWNPILGAISGSGILLLVSIVGSRIYKSQEVMGGGDIKILFPIGLLLGWRLMITSLFLSILTAAAVSVVLICFKIIDRKATVPFGPFIAIGTVLAITFGWQLLEIYFG